MFCPKCNAENDDRNTFCIECGFTLTPMQNGNESSTYSFGSDSGAFSNPYTSSIPNQEGTAFRRGAENNISWDNYPNPYAEQQAQAQQAAQQYSQPHYNQPNYTQPNYSQPMYNQPVGYNASQPDEHMTVMGWIGRWCINLIPFVGPLIYFVMLIIWAFGDTQKKSLKSYARAALIVGLIGFVITACFLAAVAETLSEISIDM